MTTNDTIHAGKLHSQMLVRYLDQFSGIPDHELSHVNFEWLAANSALANSRMADALERVLLEKDSWLAIATKLAAIQSKIEMLEKEVSAAAHAFVASSSELHMKFMELDARVNIMEGNVDTLLASGAGEQSETPDPFFPDWPDDDEEILKELSVSQIDDILIVGLSLSADFQADE